MTLDISLDAIEADLRIAERGGQVATIAMARAQVRATLLAVQPAGHEGRHETPETPTGNCITWHNSADIRIEEHPVGVVYIVPSTATWPDRVTAAAMLLGVEASLLALRLHDADGTWENRQEVAAMLLESPGDIEEHPGGSEWNRPEDYDDEPEDVFAEARQARRKK